MAFLLSRSFRRKVLAATLATAGVMLLYQATVRDTHNIALETTVQARSKPAPGAKMDFVGTAYCKGQTTASGVTVQSGIVAADPDILPEGSVVQIDGVPAPYKGIYTVMDTGPKVQGKHLDLYIWSCYEALEFGRRSLNVTVLRLGWNPKNSAPGTR